MVEDDEGVVHTDPFNEIRVVSSINHVNPVKGWSKG